MLTARGFKARCQEWCARYRWICHAYGLMANQYRKSYLCWVAHYQAGQEGTDVPVRIFLILFFDLAECVIGDYAPVFNPLLSDRRSAPVTAEG